MAEKKEEKSSEKMKKSALLGEVLVESGLITRKQLEEALEIQKLDPKPLGDLLVSLKWVSKEDIAKALGSLLGCEYINISETKIDTKALYKISEDIARRYKVLPIGFEGDKLVVAMADPSDLFTLDDLKIISGMEIKPMVSTSEEVIEAINSQYRAISSGRQVSTEEAFIPPKEEVAAKGVEEGLGVEGEMTPIIKLANLILRQAVNDGASDIHIEPQEKDFRIRFRIDGVLYDAMGAPKKVHPGLISRFKVMARMNISEKRKPQDGRFSFVMDGKRLDLRIGSMPTAYGERMTLRILDRSSAFLTLGDLGLLPETKEKFSDSFTKPYGMIMVVGPTGCGKTTTLYAALNVINSIEKNIITVEDPVEYRLPGVNQMQINARAGFVFSLTLRAILRADPDIVLIGEIRDAESAHIAIEAALTGHLVLSTLHTNEAAGTLTRLVDMGVEPFLVSSTVDCVLAERLARRLCENCKQPYNPSIESLKKIGFPVKDGEKLTLYRAKGCGKCKKTGYKGRVGIFELLPMSNAIRKHIMKNDPDNIIKKTAVEEGMFTLKRDGFEKAKLGVTSIEEVLRVVR